MGGILVIRAAAEFLVVLCELANWNFEAIFSSSNLPAGPWHGIVI